MLAGGTLLVVQTFDLGTAGLGLLAVAAATAAWAVDNTLSRPLAETPPLTVVTLKAGVGGAAALTVALAVGEPAVDASTALGLMAVGAVGYDGSLALYLGAQRHLGAGRTGSVFALGPFVGAVVAVALGDRDLGWATAGATVLFALGVWLHLAEAHAHLHLHEPLEHEHFHRHDDHHHDHDHPAGMAIPERGHSHRHAHERVVHDHPHAPDLHHVHAHGTRPAP